MKILQYPNEMLRQVCDPVDLSNRDSVRSVRALIMAMKQILHDEHGYGLAAPQVGVPIRVFLVQAPPMRAPMVFINPKIEVLSTDLVPMREGCLSFKGTFDSIARPRTVTIARLNEFGAHDINTFDGWIARAIQHEYDHLQGKLLIDKMTRIAAKKLDKILRKGHVNTAC